MRQGRPPKRAEDRRSETIGIRFTSTEIDTWYVKAAKEGTEVSPMIRRLLTDLGIFATPKTSRPLTRII